MVEKERACFWGLLAFSLDTTFIIYLSLPPVTSMRFRGLSGITSFKAVKNFKDQSCTSLGLVGVQSWNPDQTTQAVFPLPLYS